MDKTKLFFLKLKIELFFEKSLIEHISDFIESKIPNADHDGSGMWTK